MPLIGLRRIRTILTVVLLALGPEVQATLLPASTDSADVCHVIHVENERVRRFLHETTYTQDSPSVIKEYLVASSERLDQPQPARIEIPESHASITFTVREVGDTTTVFYTLTAPAGTKVLEMPNLIPGRMYTYDVKAADSILVQGKVQTEGRLRMIKVNSIANVRDLGGWCTVDGHRVCYGRLFRGSELNGGHQVDPSDVDELRRLGIGAEVDLREALDLLPYDVHGAALGSDAAYAFEDMNRWDVDALTEDTAKWRHAFLFTLSQLQAGRGVYFHCVWGADRTGCYAFLLEGLLGLSVDQLYKDYELTSFSASGERLKNGLDSKLEYINSLGGSSLQEKFFNYWHRQVGISASDLQTFISLMLED